MRGALVGAFNGLEFVPAAHDVQDTGGPSQDRAVFGGAALASNFNTIALTTKAQSGNANRTFLGNLSADGITDEQVEKEKKEREEMNAFQRMLDMIDAQIDALDRRIAEYDRQIEEIEDQIEAVDALIERVISARSPADRRVAARVLDRVLQRQVLVIGLWHNSHHRILIRRGLERPPVLPAIMDPETWLLTSAWWGSSH
jgi:hypothetical protein